MEGLPKINWWKVGGILLLVLVGMLVARVVLFPFFIANKVMDTTTGVIDRTLNADNVLFNYELFHDLYQGIRQAEANIQAQDTAIAQIKATYGADATKWPRDVRQEYGYLLETRQGYITQFNRLVGDYNSHSSKLNRTLFKDKGLPYELQFWPK